MVGESVSAGYRWGILSSLRDLVYEGLNPAINGWANFCRPWRDCGGAATPPCYLYLRNLRAGIYFGREGAHDFGFAGFGEDAQAAGQGP